MQETIHITSLLKIKILNTINETVSSALAQNFVKDVAFSIINVFDKNITQSEIIKYEL